MPQPKKGPRLGTGPSHQKLMLRNLASSLFEHERVQTTEAKAKALRPFAERLITKAKKGSVHHRRQVLADIEDRAVVHKLFAEIGPRFADRNGGYTRILKVGPRSGDGAPMALIELVEGGQVRTVEGEGGGRRRRVRRPARRRGEAAPVAEEPTETVDGGSSEVADHEVAAPQEAAAAQRAASAEDQEPGSPQDEADDEKDSQQS